MSSYVEHLEREILIYVGDGGSEFAKSVCEFLPGIYSIIEAFKKGEYSCLSDAPEVICDIINKTLCRIPFTPLTGEDDEWNEPKDGIYQNKRCGEIMKRSLCGRAFHINGIRWFEEGEVPFRGTVEGISTEQVVSFPLTPKSFLVEVVKVGDRFIIKDTEALKEVGKHYFLAHILKVLDSVPE